MPRGVGTGAPARRREPTLRPPFAKMEDARLPCAAPSPALAMAPAPAPSRTSGARPPLWRGGPALLHPPILLCPEEGERERNARPASSSRDQSVSTARSSVPRAERAPCVRRELVPAAGAISSRGQPEGGRAFLTAGRARGRDGCSLHHL